MRQSLARFLRRRRQAILAAAAPPLERSLGPDRARAEAAQLVDRLAAAFAHTDTLGVLDRLRVRFADLEQQGATSDELLAVLNALVGASRTNGSDAAGEDAGPATPLQPLLDAIPLPVLIADGSGRVVAGNRAFGAASREMPEVLRGLSLADLCSPLPAEDVAPRRPDSGPWTERAVMRAAPERVMLASHVPLPPLFAPGTELVLFEPESTLPAGDIPITEMLAREKREKEKFAALLAVSHAVVRSLDLNTILGTIAKLVREVIQTDECTVFLYDEKEQVLVPAVCDATSYVDELMAIRLKLGQGITGYVALTGQGEFVNDSEADPRAMRVPGTPPELSALLCVPLFDRDTVAGVITLTRQGARGFQQADLDLATLFAGQCSAAIANARLYAETKRAYEELRATQAQLVQSAKLNALGEMAGGVAHDFNNILAAILGRTQLMMQTLPDPAVRRQLAIIEQAALDGAHTVRRVQEFTRVRQDEHFETVDLNRILLDVLELTRPAWETAPKRRGVAIDVHLQLQATLTAAGNASELREVFTNLVLNAVDAMPNGGELWVSSENDPHGVRLQVRDNGIGMDAETRARIFDPFFTTKEVKGTGLGLSVAYGIVSRHRGTIDVESEPGVGTVFTLLFPSGEADRAAPAADPSAPLPALRALVVDDEEAVLGVLGDMLEAMGMSVTRALGGPAGRDQLDRDAFDVVFTDLGMPEVNGWELAIDAKSRRPETAVVLVTGWGFQLEEESTASRGVDLVLPKPFSWDEVEAVVRQVAVLPAGNAA